MVYTMALASAPAGVSVNNQYVKINSVPNLPVLSSLFIRYDEICVMDQAKVLADISPPFPHMP